MHAGGFKVAVKCDDDDRLRCRDGFTGSGQSLVGVALDINFHKVRQTNFAAGHEIVEAQESDREWCDLSGARLALVG